MQEVSEFKVKTWAGRGTPFLRRNGVTTLKGSLRVGKGCPHSEGEFGCGKREEYCTVKRGQSLRRDVPTTKVVLRGEPWASGERCISYGASLREGALTLGEGGTGTERRGGLRGKQGLTLEGRARGEGLRIHRSLRRGSSLEGNMCSTTTGIPRGRVENRAWAVCGRNKVSTVRRRGRISLPYSPRLPAKPSILRGKRRARGSAGRALHSADRQSGRRWAWPVRCFSHPAPLPASAPVARLSVGPSVRLSVVSRGRQGHFPVRLRAAPLLRLANLPP